MLRLARATIRPLSSKSLSLLALCRHSRALSTLSRLPSSTRPALVFPPRSVPTRFFSTNYPEHVKLAMPALSPTMTSGTLAKWNKKEGDKIKAGEVMAEVETDKATVAFEAVEPGYLAKILVPAGSKDVQLGQIVAIIVEEPSDVAAFKDFKLDGAAPATAPAAAPAAAAPAAAPATAPAAAPAAPTTAAASNSKVSASPLAKKIATEKGIDLSQVAGTGPERRIVRADVEEYLLSAPKQAVATAAPAAAPATPVAAEGAFRDIPHSNVRKVIASRLLASKQTIPHYYLTIDCQMDKLMKLRAELNAKLEKTQKLSVNDFIIKASALALRKVPTVNSSWLDNAIREYNYVDISVAVQTDTGLITPIVKDADLKGLGTISKDVKDLAGRARQNKLKPEEYQGGTFTISNLGMFGIKQFCAIINPPQSCILAVGTTETRVVANPAAKDDASAITTANFMNVTLSCDHRVVDGAVGAQWLSAFKNYIEEPSTMLL